MIYSKLELNELAGLAYKIMSLVIIGSKSFPPTARIRQSKMPSLISSGNTKIVEEYEISKSSKLNICLKFAL